MLRQKITLFVLGLALVLPALAPFARVEAASPGSGGNGLRISPVRTDLVVNPGTSKVVNINVTNVTSTPATLQTIVNDFVGNPDESGNPAIILDPGAYAPRNSLKRYATTIGDFTLTPGQSKDVPVTINLPKNAPAGGYFAAVRFAPANPGSGPNQNVTLSSSVGSLVLVKVPGDLKEEVSIASFDMRRNKTASSFFTSNKNLSATVRFQNSGNVQEAPFGKILVLNHSGKVLATYEVNKEDPPGNVLPDSIRRFSIPLNPKFGSFGQYKLEGNFGYGTSGQLLSASTTFYIIPALMIIIFAVVVAVIAFLVFGLPRLIRAYNRRVLRKAGRS